MRKVKITTIILAIVLITLVAFGGVYIKTQNRMENKVKEYQLGRELKGGRVFEIKVSDGDEENPIEQNPEDLTIENYEIVKRTLENRLNDLGAEDYTISLNEENGTIRVELAENEYTDNYAYYLIASGKVEMKEKDADTVLLNDEMIKSAKYTYSQDKEGAYQVYLELKLTKEGQAKIEEVANTYAVLAEEIDEIEAAKEKEKSEDEKSSEGAESTDETVENEEEKAENEATKKIAVLTIAENEYDIEKIEKNKIRLKIGGKTSNSTSVNNNMARAAEYAMLINAGKYPIEYEIQTNRYQYADISKEVITYGALVVLALILVVFVMFTIKYKMKGLLCSVACIGFAALLSLILRYTNVLISIEGIGAIILVLAIDSKLNHIILNKTKTMNLVNEAVIGAYKELFLKLIPIMIIAIVFCFAGIANLSSFGMIMFWGLILIVAYNITVTKALLKLVESK